MVSTRGFAITGLVENRVYVNMEVHLKLITEYKNVGAFIFNLVSTLVHEILHCFFHDSKNEQEIFELQCKELETFLEVVMPAEMKEAKASDFYT